MPPFAIVVLLAVPRLRSLAIRRRRSKSLPFNNHVRDSAFLSAGARLLVG